MVGLFVLLLVLFFGAYIFFGLDLFTQLTGNELRIANMSLQSDEFQALLGLAIIICEFVIILFSMLFSIADTLRDVIKPLARLIPLGLFMLSMYRIFSPLLAVFLPSEITGAAEVDPMEYMTAAAADGTLTQMILFSLGSMLLFVLANRALGGESSEVRALKAEVAKLRRGSR
jgi:hypothetical protein